MLEAPPSRAAAFLEPYRRITSTGRLIPEIDGLRFAAILLVYLYHLAGDLLRHSTAAYVQSLGTTPLFLVTQILNVGVPLFFVISGFVLSLPFAEAYLKLREPVSLKSYFWRRVTRLEPPYIVCILLLFALKIAAGRGTATELLPNVIASSFYMHNWVFGRPSDINVVAWSLEIEIQFYILVPFLAIVFAIGKASIRRSVLVTALLLATGLSRFALDYPALQLSLLGHAQFFLAGFLFTEFYLHKGERRKTPFWDFLFAAGWLLLFGLLVYGNGLMQWLVPWMMLVLMISAFLGTATNRFVTNQWIATIGGMCYSIYLLHNYVIAAVGFVTERLGQNAPFGVRFAVQILLMTPIVLAVGALYFRLIERPCMNPDWPRRWSSQRRSLCSLSFSPVPAGKLSRRKL